MTGPVTAPDMGPSNSILHRFNPIPKLPDYTGPHKVGTIDVEVPLFELDAPCPTPEGASDIHTIQFRIFYPAVPESDGRRITWLPNPQRQHVSAYIQFLGAGSPLASALSFLPRHLHYASIPVHKNAKALRPDPQTSSTQKWPTVIFSHGLGGNRNTYSHLAGSLASHGVVVVCPEHRDGSAAITFVRNPQAKASFFARNTGRVVPYVRLPHTQTREIWDARDKQLRIRLWELGLVFEALLGIDDCSKSIIRSNLNKSTPETALSQFAGLLDVQEPGRTILAGHSFGAASMVQLLKSTYYADEPEVANMDNPLFRPARDSGIRRQITERTPVMLLDMWCFPLLSKTSAELYKRPLPQYVNKPAAPGGEAILAVESEHFFNWNDHLQAKGRILSPDPTSVVVMDTAFERRSNSGTHLSEPYFFYVQNSAHLNQSDFGILFPWLTKRVFGAEQPERCLRLNMRAQLEFLRKNGYKVERTSAANLVDGTGVEEADTEVHKTKMGDGVDEDKAILDRRSGWRGVEAWRWIPILGLGFNAVPSELEREAGTRPESDGERAEEGERRMEDEMEPAGAERKVPEGQAPAAVVGETTGAAAKV